MLHVIITGYLETAIPAPFSLSFLFKVPVTIMPTHLKLLYDYETWLELHNHMYICMHALLTLPWVMAIIYLVVLCDSHCVLFSVSIFIRSVLTCLL